MAKRVAYADAGRAQRAALARAVAVKDQLKRRDWQVFAACVVLTASWSKTHDHVFVEQIAAFAGVSRGRTSESLRRLATLNVITWVPSNTRRRDSLLSLSVMQDDVPF